MSKTIQDLRKEVKTLKRSLDDLEKEHQGYVNHTFLRWSSLRGVLNKMRLKLNKVRDVHGEDELSEFDIEWLKEADEALFGKED